MMCPKCLSDNTRVDLVQRQKLKRGRGIWYWLTGYFILDWFSWIAFTPIKLITRLVKGPNYKLKTREQKRLVCNSCGYTRRIR